MLGLSALLLVVELLALEEHGWPALAAVGFGVLFVPVGLSLLAEPVTRWFQRPGREAKVGRAVLAGAAVFAVDAGIAVLRVDHKGILLAFGAIAFLTLAIVSSTQADIAAVGAAVMLMGVTSMSEPKPEALQPQPGQAGVLLALGDSYMSGEGADIYYREEGGHREPLQPGSDRMGSNGGADEATLQVGRVPRLFPGLGTYNVRHEDPLPAHGQGVQEGSIQRARHPARPGRRPLGRGLRSLPGRDQSGRQRRRVLHHRHDVPGAGRTAATSGTCGRATSTRSETP